MNNIFLIIFVVVGIVMVAAVMFVAITTIKRSVAPMEIKTGKVISKRKTITDPTALTPMDELGNNWYFVTFDINGENIEYSVRKHMYNDIQEGDYGELHCKAEYLVEFVKKNS